MSSANTSVHNLATHMCQLPCNCHLHSQWARLRHTKVACHIHVSFAPALTETRRFGTLFLFCFTLVAEPRSSASGLDRSTQQGELRSSAMSGGTDRREDEQVPQFYGRIDEKFAEWEIVVKLWEAEYKEDDRVRLGPQGAWAAEDHCEKQSSEHMMLHSSQWTTSPNASRTIGMKNFLKSLDKRHWITIST